MACDYSRDSVGARLLKPKRITTFQLPQRGGERVTGQSERRARLSTSNVLFKPGGQVWICWTVLRLPSSQAKWQLVWAEQDAVAWVSTILNLVQNVSKKRIQWQLQRGDFMGSSQNWRDLQMLNSGSLQPQLHIPPASIL